MRVRFSLWAHMDSPFVTFETASFAVLFALGFAMIGIIYFLTRKELHSKDATLCGFNRYSIKVFFSFLVGFAVAILSRAGFLGNFGALGVPFSAYSDCKMQPSFGSVISPHITCDTLSYGNTSIVYNILFWAMLTYLLMWLSEYIIIKFKNGN